MTQGNDDVVVTLVRLEPEILGCSNCDGVRFHIYDDGSMVCAKKGCGMKTRIDLYKDDDDSAD